MSEMVQPGEGLRIDDGVCLGYSPERVQLQTPLILGRFARLRSGTVLYLGSTIGDYFSTGHHVVLREECVIGDHVSVWSNSVIDYGSHIGSGVKIHANCYIAQYSRICDDAFLAPGVTFANDLYPGHPESAGAMTGPTIEAGAQLGVNVTVLPFVTVGDGAMIGAGAVVTRDIPPGTVAAGCPATVIGEVRGLKNVHERIEPLAGSPGRFRFKPSAAPRRRAT